MLYAGITMVHDLGTCPTDVDEMWENLLQVYLPAADENELQIRILAMIPLYSW